LDVKKHNPWFLYILSTIALINLVIFAGVFFLSYRIITSLGQLNSLILLLCLLSIGGIIWNKGNKAARFYVIGYCLYFICVLPAILKNFLTIPTSFYLFIEHGTELGVLCEAILLSIGLADKTRLERRKAQREKEEAQQETIRVQQEANEMLEKKVDERTKQLQEVNEELRTSEEEIRQQAEELRATNESLNLAQSELQIAFNEIEQKNKDITASINYASRIQSALLALDEEIKNVFPQNFIFFKPRDIVSGDFYWFYKKENKSIVIAIDCTGHGVPGAFMSMIADSLLNQIIIEKEITQADLILNEMQKSIQKSLKQDITENRDGMDLALCIVDHETQTLEYAGAHNPLIIIQNNQMREIKGDPFGIGGYQGREAKSFTRHIVDINPKNVGKTIFYLYSDGFQDQFGGPDNKKFLPRRFRELLFNIHQQPLKSQKELLENTFKNWVEPENRQIDDVLVIGVELNS
jgi:serine phosphatase RsbU (regulator of sigma subunit)